MLLKDSISRNSNDYREHRAEVIKDGVRKISPCSHTHYRSLSHTTRIPRNEWRSNGHRIFRSATQEACFITIIMISFLKHIPREDDGNVLIGSNDVEQKSRTYR